MLGIAAVRGPSLSYYLGDLPDGASRATPPWARPRWVGDGACGLGLAGVPADHLLEAVVAGRHPATGRPLVSRPRTVAAYDLTFTSPKSVSVLFALGGAEAAHAVEAAQREALDAAVDYLTKHALGARRASGDERPVIDVDGPIAAAIPHLTSRTGDPHLHTHLLVANMAHGSDGRWSALDGRGLFAHREALGALFDAHVRAALTDRLGVAWHERRGSYDMTGIGGAAIGAFSGRHADIGAQMSGRPTSPGARRVAWAITREAKGPSAARPVLFERWRRRAAEAGVELDLSHALGQGGDRMGRIDERRFMGALVGSERGSWSRRDVVAAWSGALRDGGRASEIESSVDLLLGDAPPGRGCQESPVRAGHVLASGTALARLGPRPASPGELALWLEGAGALAAHHRRWGRDGLDEALPGHRGTRPARQIADELQMTRRVDLIRQRLGGVSAREVREAQRVWERS